MSLFSFLSIVGVAVGVWMLAVVHSVMNGFGENIRDLIGATGGHVRIENASGRGVIEDYATLIAMAEQLPAVTVAAPYIEERAMIQHVNRPALPLVRTYTPEGDIMPFEELLRIGDMADFKGDVVVLTVGLAASIGAMVGSEIDIFTPNFSEGIQDSAAWSQEFEDEPVRLRTLTVVGIVETGYGQVDGNTIFIPMPLMCTLFDLCGGVHGVSMRLSDRDLAEATAMELNASLSPELRAVTWLEDSQDLLFVLRLEKTMMTLVIIVISVVAAFSIVITLFTTVVSKTHEIGLYQALGGLPVQVGRIFCLQGLFIGVVGSIIGVVTAELSLHYRHAIMHLFYSEAQMFYNPFLHLPSSHTFADLMLFAVIAIVLSTLAGFVPSRRAARLKPADALRQPC